MVRAVASGEHLGEKWSSCIVGGHVELEAEADSGVPGCGRGWTAVFTTWDTCILGLANHTRQYDSPDSITPLEVILSPQETLAEDNLGC